MGIFTKSLIITIICLVLIPADVTGRPTRNAGDQLVKFLRGALDNRKVRSQNFFNTHEIVQILSPMSMSSRNKTVATVNSLIRAPGAERRQWDYALGSAHPSVHSFVCLLVCITVKLEAKKTITSLRWLSVSVNLEPFVDNLADAVNRLLIGVWWRTLLHPCDP